MHVNMWPSTLQQFIIAIACTALATDRSNPATALAQIPKDQHRKSKDDQCTSSSRQHVPQPILVARNSSIGMNSSVERGVTAQ